MTKAQEKTLNRIIETYDFNKNRYNKLENKDVNWWWVELIKQDMVEVSANTKTLQALEREGYIKIVKHIEYTNFNTDYIKLLKRN